MLDPQKMTRHKFGHIINYHIGKKYTPTRKPKRPLTLTFAVGGAGAQSDIGIHILQSLRQKILSKDIRLNVVAGTRKEVFDQYSELIHDLKLKKMIGSSLTILYEKTKQDYFVTFNKALRSTDVLWTKPSELSFYTALGLPIIMAPSIGSQEDFNRIWLKTVAGGISQEDPRYTDEWLFEWINSGWLARAALNGFVEAPIMGTYNIERVIEGKDHEGDIGKDTLLAV